MKKSIKKKFKLWASIFALIIASTAFIYKYNSLNYVNANPDYICTKSVINTPCEIDSCDDWDSEWHFRICTWTKVTQVKYYATRTGCSTWYTTTMWGGYTSWASWRKTPDRPSSWDSCTVTQYDTVAPSWKVD